MTQENLRIPKQMTSGKYRRLMALADEHGVIAALAIDQRGSLKKALTALTNREIAAHEIEEFKTLVSEVLTPYASAILLDPEYGLEAARHRANDTGLLLAYEISGYDTTTRGRFPSLHPAWSVARIVETGADAVKVLIYYDPDDDLSINDVKHAFVERIGAECHAYDIPFFLEVVSYSDSLGGEKSFAFAQAKPQKVMKLTREFSRPCYGVDVLKLEIPINMQFLTHDDASGPFAYTREEAKQYFRAVAEEAQVPFIFLSAGVSNTQFLASLALANEASIPYAGVLCGRATWQDSLPVYMKGGTQALRSWLGHEGRQNIEALNSILRQGAQPWWNRYGGRDNLTIVDSPQFGESNQDNS
ncbi:MAG TPA: tagatose 1,6-diphosphate aldolase [Ktedonobacteraceae bacterium]|nr:tagatose 1,6-diphosphate aldolase [Ktedonobacteraceae bacterium]